MPDYFAMGSGLASAYTDGTEEKRLRDRQIDQDARQKVVDSQRDKDFGDRQTVFGQGQTERTNKNIGLGRNMDGTMPAREGLPVGDVPVQGAPASPIGVRDAAPPQVSAGLPASPIGVRDAASPQVSAGLPASPIGVRDAAPASGLRAQTASVARPADHETITALKDKLYRASASGDQNLVNQVHDEISAQTRKLRLAGTADSIMKMAHDDPRLTALYDHINTHSKTLFAENQLDPKGKPTGYTTLKIRQADGTWQTSQISRADLATVAVGEQKIQDGDYEGGLADMKSVSKTLAAAVAAESNMVNSATAANNTARHQQVTGAASTMSAQAAQTSAGAAASNAATNAKVADAQLGEIEENRANNDKARELLGSYHDLTPEQQASPAGRGLLKQFNLVNSKPGTQLAVPEPRGAGGSGRSVLALPVEQKQNSDGTYTAFAKDGGQALYNTINGAPIPLGMSATEYGARKTDALRQGVQMTVINSESGRLILGYTGKDGSMYTSPEEAAAAKAPPAPKAPYLPIKVTPTGTTHINSDGRRYVIPPPSAPVPVSQRGVPLPSRPSAPVPLSQRGLPLSSGD